MVLKSCEKERQLAGFLSTVYEMIRLQPKKTVDLFVRSYNSGISARCLCRTLRSWTSQENENSQTDLISGSESAGTGPMDPKPEETATPTERSERRQEPKGKETAEEEQQAFAVGIEGSGANGTNTEQLSRFELPLLENYGSHLATDDECPENAMDPFVYTFLLNGPKMLTFVEQREISEGQIATERRKRSMEVASVTEKGESEEAQNLPEESIAFGDQNYQNVERSFTPIVSESEQGIARFQELEGTIYPKDNNQDSQLMSVKELQLRTQYRAAKAASRLNELGDNRFVMTLYDGQTVSTLKAWQPLAHMFVLGHSRGYRNSNISVVEPIMGEKYLSSENIQKKLRESSQQQHYGEHQRNYIVGLLGEEYVYTVLREMLKKEISNKEVEVAWHNELEEQGEAYDITIRNSRGEVVYIEVKSSASMKRHDFRISYNQWLFAQHQGNRYEIFRLGGVGHQETIMVRLMNPYNLWKHGLLGLSVSLV